VDADGHKVAETSYRAARRARKGEGARLSGRYATPGDQCPPTRLISPFAALRGQAGQRSEDFGLMDYNAGIAQHPLGDYDPLLGKFISPDTIIPEPGNPLAWDRYGYAYNNPIMFTDPSGHFTEDAIKTYLKDTYGDDWENVWNSWLLDEQWMNTLYGAQAGDTLSHVWYDLDGNEQINHYLIEGESDQVLNGLSGTDSPDLNSIYGDSAGIGGIGVVRYDDELGFMEIGSVGNIYYNIHKTTVGESIGYAVLLAGTIGGLGYINKTIGVVSFITSLCQGAYQAAKPQTAFMGALAGDISLSISSSYVTGMEGPVKEGYLTTWVYKFRFVASGRGDAILYQKEGKHKTYIHNPRRG